MQVIMSEWKGILSGSSLQRLVEDPTPVVNGLRTSEQLQPNGIDFTVERVWEVASRGRIGEGNTRELPERREVTPDSSGFFLLQPGCYVVSLHETLAMTDSLMAIGQPRSSLLRMGAGVTTAVFDAGYRGRPEVLLTVSNPYGLSIHSLAAICQLIFLPLAMPAEPYSGYYQETLEVDT